MRQAALEIIEFALEQTAPYKAVQSLVRLDGSQMTVENLQLNLEDHQRIFLLGAGKATYPIARALDVPCLIIAGGETTVSIGENTGTNVNDLKLMMIYLAAERRGGVGSLPERIGER
jgi:glycerate-2-kinase